MLQFRNVFLGVAAAALAVSSAYGQGIPDFTGAAATPSAVYAAVEGTTELLPTITYSGNTTTATGTITFYLSSNVPFTNETPTGASSLDVTATANATNTVTGTVTSLGPTQLQVTFNGISGSPSTITISGLRVNASLATSPTITVTASSPAAAGIEFTGTAAAPVTEAYVVKSLTGLTITGAANEPLASATSSTAFTVATVTLSGAFTDAFKSASDYSSGTGVTVSQGTTLAVTFSNLDANVNYYVPLTVGDGTLVLTASTSSTYTAPASTVTTAHSPVLGLVALPTPVNGSSTIYYSVTTGEPTGTGAISTHPITLTAVVPSQAAVTTVTSTSPAVSVSLVGVSTGYPEFSTSQTPYTATIATSCSTVTPTATCGLITLSTTTIVFPYVTNLGGFDTGLVVTNATGGLSNGSYSSTATGTSGSFSVYFYGTNAPSAPYVGAVEGPGAGTPFLLSGVAPNFDGYLVVVANFSNAYGFALVTNGAISQGYLAVIAH